jgi:uncharacterized protein (TIGR02466 family)
MRYEIFPSPLWIVNYDDIDTSSILDLCNTLRNADPTGRVISNRGGWQSMDLSAGSFTELKQFEEELAYQAKLFLDDIGYETNVEISNMWFNINSEKTFNATHIHPKSILSGVFYLEIPEGSGNLVFHRNSHEDFILSSFNVSKFTPSNACEMRFKPVKNRMMLFPAWMPHSVDSTETADSRISIAFNIKQK